jgi:hypothetical protein
MEPVERITSRILLVRGQKVLLDVDLAELYGVSTGRFNEQVRRNRDRFPSDFMFQLTNQEVGRLRSQIAISIGETRLPGRGGRRYLPQAFTEHGAIMAATILHTPQATDVAVFVVRAFVRLREMVAANRELAKKLDELERRVSNHDEAITSIVKAIRELATPPEPKPKRRIGFIQ